MDTCRACGSDFVHPVSWEEEDQDRWWMLLHCGACDHWWDAVVCNEAAEEFDAKLAYHERLIGRAADRFNREWRSAEVDAFAGALDHDLITADDFAR